MSYVLMQSSLHHTIYSAAYFLYSAPYRQLCTMQSFLHQSIPRSYSQYVYSFCGKSAKCIVISALRQFLQQILNICPHCAPVICRKEASFLVFETTKYIQHLYLLINPGFLVMNHRKRRYRISCKYQNTKLVVVLQCFLLWMVSNNIILAWHSFLCFTVCKSVKNIVHYTHLLVYCAIVCKYCTLHYR